MKRKLKELTARSNGWSNDYRILRLKQFIRGWVNYYKLADMKRMLQDTDEWLRHRIRAIYWKQWKKVRTRIRKGIWRSAIVLNMVLTNKRIASLGYISMTDYYLQV